MFVRILMLGATMIAAACGGTRAPVAVPGAPGITIPRNDDDQLDRRWSNWQIVPPAAEAAACTSRFSDPPSAVVTGDWNGDGMIDLAFQVSTPAGRRVVAAFGRLDDEYVLSDVTATPDAAGVLGVERKAGAYRQQPDGATFFYSLDTIAFGACTQPEMAYFWTGTVFEGRAVYD
jgi:hypothetical protein